MKEITGAHVREWLLSQEGSPNAIPDNNIVEHIAACDSCQGALLVLMVRLLAVPLEIEEISCDQCQDDIAAYIDVEQTYGPRIAAQRLPAVWWHLWTCSACAEMYQDTVDFLQGELADSVEHPNHTQTNVLFIELPVKLTIPQRKALVWSSDVESSRIKTRVAAARFMQGAYGEADDLNILDQKVGSYSVQMSVKQQDNEWVGLVQVEPPIPGLVALTLGDEILSARLDRDGHATIPALPLDRLIKEEQDLPITLVIKALPEE